MYFSSDAEYFTDVSSELTRLSIALSGFVFEVMFLICRLGLFAIGDTLHSGATAHPHSNSSGSKLFISSSITYRYFSASQTVFELVSL